MVNLMRRYQQGLLMVITVIIIIAFAWLYNDYGFRAGGHDDTVGIIYDRPIRLGEYQRVLRRMQLSGQLGFNEYVEGLAGNATSMEQAQQNFVFNSYVLRHEAEVLGLTPSDEEKIEATKKVRAFQSADGQFDSTMYNQIVQNIGRLGFGAEAIEEAVADDLRYRKLRDLFSATISASPASAREMFEQRNQKSEASLVRIKEADIAGSVQVTDEDLKKAFDERKDALKTDEMRKAKYVLVGFSDDEKKLVGPDKAAVYQKLLDKANELAVAMTQPNASFEEVVGKAGLKAAETAEFTQDDPPTELGDSREATAAAFKLSLEQPNSSPIGTVAGYYVLQLTGITASRQLSFDEAKVKLASTLKRERTQEAMMLKATELRNKIDAELTAGKPFADAAKAAGLTAETLPAFSFLEPPKPDFQGGREILMASIDLEVGKLSEPVPVQGGSILFRIEKRLPIDEATFDKEKGQLLDSLTKYQVRSAFPLWMTERLKAANLVKKGV